MGRVIIFLIASVVMTGCADFDLQVKKGALRARPSTVLIGSFELRSMNYDPYVAQGFREALRFEFFKRGIPAVLTDRQDEEPANDSQKVAGMMGKYSADVFIKGAICQRESGFLADLEVNSSISFVVYGKEGTVIGEGYYYIADRAGNETVKRRAAAKFVSEFLGSTISE